MNNLVKKCKEAYRSNNLDLAGKYWNEIYEKYAPSIKEDEKTRYEKYEKLNKLMSDFTDEEVYDITDYLKEQEYKKEGCI